MAYAHYRCPCPIFPPKIAEKASRSIGSFYNSPIQYKGSIEELIASGDRISVDYYIVHSTATKADQVCSINDFIIGSCREESRFIGFGTMHHGFPDIHGEFSRMQAGGLRGLKLHPDFQGIAATIPGSIPYTRNWRSVTCPFLSMPAINGTTFPAPSGSLRVLDRHPRLKMIAAHFGGYTEWEESLEHLAGRRCCF